MSGWDPDRWLARPPRHTTEHAGETGAHGMRVAHLYSRQPGRFPGGGIRGSNGGSNADWSERVPAALAPWGYDIRPRRARVRDPPRERGALHSPALGTTATELEWQPGRGSGGSRTQPDERICSQDRPHALARGV